MEDIINNLQFSSVWWAIATPLVLIILDVLTGVIVAWKNNDLKSAKMRTGLTKKFGEIIYVVVGILTKFALGVDLIMYFAIGYICLMEISSLFENCDKLGVPIPDKIKGKINNVSNSENVDKNKG